MSIQERMEIPKSVFSALGGGTGTAQAEQTVQQTQALSSKIRVISGANQKYIDNLVGKDVGYVRKRLKEQFNIAGDAVAFVSGKEVSDDFILESGQSLQFMREAGDKG